MLSLPNSGSTWFGEQIARNIEGCRCAPEFFNPIRNFKHERALVQHFGCELVECYDKIADPGDFRADRCIKETWGTEGFTFTKEVFSPMKLELFMRHFRCFVFLRPADLSFPPTRARVWSFYEHAYWALHNRGYGVGEHHSVRQRAIAAHTFMSEHLRFKAAENAVPVIWHHDLFRKSSEAMQDFLTWALKSTCDQDGLDVKQLVADIVATRLDLPRQESLPVSPS